MTAISGTESFNQLLAKLHAARIATWRPESLRVNVEPRQLLVDSENTDDYA